MKLEYKSMFIGIVLGAISVSAIFFLLGDVEKELSFSTGDKKQDKNIEVSIERIIENGEDLKAEFLSIIYREKIFYETLEIRKKIYSFTK